MEPYPPSLWSKSQLTSPVSAHSGSELVCGWVIARVSEWFTYTRFDQQGGIPVLFEIWPPFCAGVQRGGLAS